MRSELNPTWIRLRQGLLRVLCLFTWCLSLTYSQDDYETVSRPFFHPETMLSFTVTLLWLRSLQALAVFETTGPLVVILSRIWKDVVRVISNVSLLLPPQSLHVSMHCTVAPSV